MLTTLSSTGPLLGACTVCPVVRPAEIGLLLPGGLSWRSVLEWVDRCRRWGLDRLWLSDEGAAAARVAGLGRRYDGLRVGLSAGEMEEAAAVLSGMAGGEAYWHRGRLSRAEGARCLPPSPQVAGYPLWSAETTDEP